MADTCTFQHSPVESCSGLHNMTCECGAQVCSSAIVYRTQETNGLPTLVRECARCAEKHMVPVNYKAALSFVTRAMRSAHRHQVNEADAQATLNIFEAAARQIEQEAGSKNGIVVMRFERTW